VKVIAIQSDLAREFERKPQGTNMCFKVRDLSRLAVRSLTVVSNEDRLAASAALRHLARKVWNHSAVYVVRVGQDPQFVANGHPVSDEEQVGLQEYLSLKRGQLALLLSKEKKLREDLVAVESQLPLLAMPFPERTMKVNQELDLLESQGKEIERQLAEIPAERDNLKDCSTIADLSSMHGRWAVVRPAVARVQLSFDVEGHPELGPLPPKSNPHCEVIGRMLMHLSKHQNNLDRAFYLAPLTSVDANGKPLGMPIDALREWRAQKGVGKSGKSADREEALDAWHYLVFSWNSAFPADKVRETEDGRRSRSNSGSGPSPPPSKAGSSGTSAPPPAWVQENASLKARILALEDELATARLTIQSQDRQLSDLAMDDQSAFCPMCPHCLPDILPAVVVKEEKKKGVERPLSKEGTKVPRPSSPPKSALKKEPGQANGGKSPVPPPSSTATKGKVELKLDDAKAIRQALGLPHRDSVEDLSPEERNTYYGKSRIPAWASRGFALRGQAFLDDVRTGVVSGENFNSWFSSATRPSRANLVAEWTEIRNRYTGVRLTARPSTAAEQKFRGAYDRLRHKGEKLGITDVVPRSLPDRGPSRSRSRGRATSRARSTEPRGPPQPAPAPSGTGLSEQQFALIVEASVRAVLEATKKK